MPAPHVLTHPLDPVLRLPSEFPFGLAGSYVVGLIAYLLKLIVAGVLLGVFEMSIAKMRIFRVPNFLGAALMLALLGVLLRFVSEGM